jgi:hypothetical protein
MEHLPVLIHALYVNDYYSTSVNDSFRITTEGSYKTARMYLGLGKQSKSLALKLSELQNLNSIVCIVANQLTRYSGAVVEVMNYSTSTLAYSEFIETQPHYSKHDSVPSAV